MPVVIRSLSPTISVASYRFPAGSQKIVAEEWPWLRNPSSSSALCQNCSRLNFAWLFSQTLSAYTVTDGSLTAKLSDGIYLGIYEDVSRRSRCRFCQLLVHAVEEGADIEMLNRYDEWPQQEVWINNYVLGRNGFVMDPGESSERKVVRLGVRLKAENEENVIVSFRGGSNMIQRVFEDNGNARSGFGRAVDTQPECLVQTIKKWVQPCLSRRKLGMEAKRVSGTSIRLIDTSKHCIVGPMQNERYVALSYTWGKIDPLVLLERNNAELRLEGALEACGDRLPITIQDAMKLCASLGERYLWVDSLCIMQDTTDKHSQIQQMDRIYQEATFCIVAAAGMDANFGLPGVSKVRDVRQHTIEVDNMRLANTLPPLIQSLSQAYWESRGWCFQEGLLSLRKVIFTSDQVYYHCQHGECSEDVFDSMHDTYDLAKGGIPWRLNLEGQTNWSIYDQVVAEYSTRYLSYESDVLNAFAGISAYLSHSVFLDSPFVMGIPICSLEVGLMWYPSTRLQRRTGVAIPSWSWAGWVGHVEYPGSAEHEKIFERTISQIKWHTEAGEDLITCIPPPSWQTWTDWKRIVAGELDDVHYTHAAFGPDRWFAHPIVQRQWAVYPRGPLLKCTAEVACLKLTSEHTEFWSENEVCLEGHEVCHLKVLDHQDRLAGIVVMDGATYERTSFDEQPFEFIKISRTTLTALDDPAWDPEMKRFAGQLGGPPINPRLPPPLAEDEFDQEFYDRNICWCMYNVLAVRLEGNIAKRLAAGRIYYSAFDNACPERRVIQLG